MSKQTSPPAASPAAPAQAAPTPAAVVPANEYERFLAALPESFREPCRNKLKGAGLAVNHPFFQALAKFYEKASGQADPESKPDAAPPQKEAARNFIQEATLHADHARQLLNDFQKLPQAILSQVEPRLLGLLSDLTGPVQKLAVIAVPMQRYAEALPKRPDPGPRPEKLWWRPFWYLWRLILFIGWVLSDRPAWIATGSVAAAVTIITLCFGASHVSRYYEASYQDRLAHMEADSAQNTIALNRLLAAGIALKVEKSKDGNAWFLILPGAQKAAQPVNSPEGLAVEVWPGTQP